jgi:hypothetical protein
MDAIAARLRASFGNEPLGLFSSLSVALWKRHSSKSGAHQGARLNAIDGRLAIIEWRASSARRRRNFGSSHNSRFTFGRQRRFVVRRILKNRLVIGFKFLFETIFFFQASPVFLLLVTARATREQAKSSGGVNMRRPLIFHLFLPALALFLSNYAEAADFTCVAPPALGRLGPELHNDAFGSYYFWEGKDEHDCWRIAIEGKITSGDANKLEWLLTKPSHSPEFLLQSPGGNLLEAMTMGRLLHASFASIETKRSKCGGPGQAVCCASACALVYLGAARWNPGDLLGLHRPTLEDLGQEDYSKARTALQDASILAQQYLKEMEIDGLVFDDMMRTGPEQLVIWTVLKKYPPSLQEWLMAKCQGKNDKDYCMREQLRDLSNDQGFSDYEEAKRFSWYSYKIEIRTEKDVVGPFDWQD